MPAKKKQPYYTEFKTVLRKKLQAVRNELSQLSFDAINPDLTFFDNIREGITKHPLREYQKDALYILNHIYQYAQNAINVPDVLKNNDYRHIKPLFEVIDRESKTKAPFIGFEMATGSGKTMLMGATVYYLNQVHKIKNFLIICPKSLEIYNKTIRNFTKGTSESVWSDDVSFSFNLVTGDNYKERTLFDDIQKDATIFIFNIDKFGAKAKNTDKRWEASIWKDKDGNTVSLRDYLSQNELIIITDEAHHTQGRKSAGIIKKFRPNAVIEFTATAVELSKSEAKKNQTIVYKYDIRRFLDDKYGKLVRVLALAEDISAQYTKKKGKQTEVSGTEKLKLQTFFLVHLLKKKAMLLDPTTRSLKAIGFVKVKNVIKYAEKVEKYIKEELASDTDNLQIILDKAETEDLETTNLIREMFEQDYDSDIAGLQKAIDKVAKNAILYTSESEPTVKKQFETIQRNQIEIVIYIDILNEGIDMPNIYSMVVINDTVTDLKTAVRQIVGRGVRLNKEKREFDNASDNPLLTHAEKLHIICDKGKAFQEVIEEIQKEFGLNDKLFGSERGKKITVRNRPKSDKLKGICLPKIEIDFKRKEGISILELIKDADTIISEYQNYNCFSWEHEGAAKSCIKFAPAAFFTEIDLFADKSIFKQFAKEQNWKSGQLLITDREIKKIYGRIIVKLNAIPDIPATYETFLRYKDRLNKIGLFHHYLDESDHILALNQFTNTFVYFYINYIEDKYFELDFRTFDSESDSWILSKVFDVKTIKIREKDKRNKQRKEKDREKAIRLIGQNFYFYGYEHSIYDYDKFDSYPEKQLADYVNWLIQSVKPKKGNEPFWVRNERDIYFEYGSHKYYPDFIFFYNQIIYVIEIKGEHVVNYKKHILLIELNKAEGMGRVEGYRGLVIFSVQMDAMKDNFKDFQSFIEEAEAALNHFESKFGLKKPSEVPDEEKYVTYLPAYSPEKAYRKFIQGKDVKVDGWLEVKKKNYPKTAFATMVKSYDLELVYPVGGWIVLDSEIKPDDLNNKIVLIHHKNINDDAYKHNLTIRKLTVTEETKSGELFSTETVRLPGSGDNSESITIENYKVVGVKEPGRKP